MNSLWLFLKSTVFYRLNKAQYLNPLMLLYSSFLIWRFLVLGNITCVLNWFLYLIGPIVIFFVVFRLEISFHAHWIHRILILWLFFYIFMIFNWFCFYYFLTSSVYLKLFLSLGLGRSLIFSLIVCGIVDLFLHSCHLSFTFSLLFFLIFQLINIKVWFLFCLLLVYCIGRSEKQTLGVNFWWFLQFNILIWNGLWQTGWLCVIYTIYFAADLQLIILLCLN